MALDFSDQAAEAKPDFSSQAAPDFAAEATAAPAKRDNTALIAERDTYAARASRWNSLADLVGGLKDYVVAPLANPPQTIMDAGDAIAKQTGFKPVNEISQPPRANIDLGPAAEDAAYKLGYGGTAGPAVAKGAGEAASDFINSQLTPENLVLLPASGAGGVAGRIAQTGFATQMVGQIPEAAAQAGAASVTGDTAEKTRAYLNATAATVLPGLMAAHPVLDFSSESTTPEPKAEPATSPAGKVSEFGGDVPAPPPADFSAQAELSGPPPPAPVPEVQTPAPAADAPPSDLAGAPVQRIDADAIATRPDLMQFKRMDDTGTGVNDQDKLGGDWDDLKAGNLLLWEPKDPSAYGLEDGEKYIVANGHHRFEFGDRQDVPAYNAQVIREADGYSAQDARSLAAEVNIADGKGTIYDAVKFLRNESATHGPDAALARAGQIGLKGRQAATIAFAASPDTFDSFTNERIRPDQAEAIAASAPVTTDQAAEPLQRMAIKAALDGTSPQGIRNLVQAVRLESANVPMDQLDLFGADDSAMNAAEQLSKVAGKLQNTLSAEIRSTDAAAKNAETAKAKGVSFDRPPEEILADNNRLKAERARWDNWSLHPDLVSQVREYARMQRDQKLSVSDYGVDLSDADASIYGTGKPKGVPAADVKALVGELKEKLPGAPKTRVVQSVSELSPAEQKMVRDYEVRNKSVGGWFDRGTGEATIIADNLHSLKHARDTVREEMFGHGGMEPHLGAGDFEGLFQSIQMHKPAEAAAIVKAYGLDMGKAEDREALVREYVAKQTDLLDRKDPVWIRVRDVVLRALKRAGILPDRWHGAAFEAQMRALARKGIGRLQATPREGRAGIDTGHLPNIDPTHPALRLSISQHEPTPAGPEGQEEPTRQRVETIAAGDASADVKTATGRDAFYQVRSHEYLTNLAKDIMAQHGVDGAFELFRRGGDMMQNDTRTALGAELERTFRGEEQRARASGDTARADAMAQRQVDLWRADAYGTELAQALSARQLYDDSSPQAKLKQAQDLFDDSAKKKMAVVAPAAEAVRNELEEGNREAADALRQDPEVNAAARTAVNQHIAESPETHRAVVMDLTEGQSQSNFVLQGVKDLVRERAAELLGPQRSRFPQPTERLREIMDDLAKRAASIAAGHYQGAEPGVTLAEKLEKRLGIEKGKAAQMARAFDAQWIKMVEAAKKKIPQRVATQRARRDLLTARRASMQASGDNWVRQARNVWDREKESAVQRLVQATKTAPVKTKAALEEFTNRLTANLRGQLAAKGTPQPGLTDMQAIREGILNQEKYQQVWEQTKTELQHQWREDPTKLAEVDKIFNGSSPVLFQDSRVDGVIRDQLKAMNQKLGDVVTQHVSQVDAAGRTLADRIIEESGLTGDAAEKLRDTINRRWNALADAAKKSRLDQLAKAPAGLPRPVRGMLPDLMRLTNLGAFDNAKYFDLVKRKLDLPVMTDGLAREIVSRANALERIPAGDLRDRAGTQLLNWIVQQRGVDWGDLPMAVYVSNLLSGIKTPVKILFENGTLLASQTLATLRNPDLIRHPVAFVAKPWAQGQLKGMLQSLEVLRSGIVTGVREAGSSPSSVLEQRPFGKYDDWLNIWKYPMRLVAAAHVPLFKPALDLKTTALAVDVARREGLKGAPLVQRVADLMGNTEARVTAAKAQAQAELRGLGYFDAKRQGEGPIDYGRRQAGEALDYRRRVYEILDQQRNAALGDSATQNARDYALHFTYLNKPYGFVGFIGEALRKAVASGRADHPVYAAALKSQVPFTTVASNIINEHLNWTPIGLARAALSHWTDELYGQPIADPTARGDLYARAAAGTVLASGLAAAVGRGWMQVNGPGPSTPQAQRQWRDAGNEPWSMTVGGRRFSYANTPWASSLAVLGAWNDFKKYGKGDEADANTRLAFAMKAIASQALNVPMLTGLHDLVDAINPSGADSDKGAKLEKLFVRTGANFVVPKWLKDVDQTFDPAVYDTTGMKALLASQVPFVRRGNQPALNRLGEPIQRELFSGWTGAAVKDPVWRTIVDKGAWIPEPDRNHIVGDKKLGPDFYRTITPDELYDVVKETGPRIRERLQQAIDLPQMIGNKLYMPLPSLDPAAAKELVHRITTEEENRAYSRLR